MSKIRLVTLRFITLGGEHVELTSIWEKMTLKTLFFISCAVGGI